MIVLSKELIIMLHQEIIDETGGSTGIKDEGLLESALAAPFQSYDNQDLFPLFIKRLQDLVTGLQVTMHL